MTRIEKLTFLYSCHSEIRLHSPACQSLGFAMAGRWISVEL